MAQVRIEPLHVLVLPGREIPETAPRLAADGGPYTQRGSTQHFIVYYEDSLGANGPTLADAVLASCENDYTSLQNYFGGITPGGLPFSIYVVSGNFGAYHASCAATECHCAAFAGTDANLVRMLVVAEEDEVFMANQNVGWDCGASNGEGLSRVLATELYPAELNGFASAASWLDSNRPDFVNNTDPTDRNYVSIGCSTLFLNWLHYQLHFSWSEIILAGAPTLAQTYTNLTGRTDAWARFRILLQNHFPPGKPSGLTTDNPFPLMPFSIRILETGTTFAPETDGVWLMADYDRDGIPDLVFIKTSNTGTGTVEVHIASGASNYQTRILETGTTFAPETDGVWLMADYDRDGIPDLVFIKTANTGTGTVEVHIASGASNYQTRILETGTTFAPETDGVWLMADYEGDGIPDLVFIKTANTGTGTVEVHIASGASNYQTRFWRRERHSLPRRMGSG